MRTTILAAPLLVVLVAGCTGTSSYKSQTEKFLNDSTEASSSVGGDIENAECVEPDDTEVGTTYTCTADVDGVSQNFDVEITPDDNFRVSSEF